MDLVFIVDASGSICDVTDKNVKPTGCPNWRFVIQFMKSVVDGMKVGPDDVNVGLVIFATNAAVAWRLNE